MRPYMSEYILFIYATLLKQQNTENMYAFIFYVLYMTYMYKNVLHIHKYTFCMD